MTRERLGIILSSVVGFIASMFTIWPFFGISNYKALLDNPIKSIVIVVVTLFIATGLSYVIIKYEFVKKYIETLVSYDYLYKMPILATLLLLITVVTFDYSYYGKIVSTTVICFAIILSVFISIDNTRADKPIKGFKTLHNKMINEMKRLNDIPRGEIESNSLVTLSYTPAFGNISEPESFELYKESLNNLIKRGMKVTIICYNKEKREQFHLHWAKVRTEKDNTNKELTQQAEMKKWEEQASNIIKKIRDTFGYNAVREFGDIHPIFVFASTKVAFLYTMKEDTEQIKNDIVGTETRNLETIKFINESLQTYLTSLPSLLQKLNPLLTELDKEGAKKLMDLVVGEASKRKVSVEKIDVLIAYGGGKDSTWALAFIRYVQELVRQNQLKTFTLHIVTYIHAGMVKSVIENIKSVYKNLELRETKEVKRYFTTGNGTQIKEQEILGGKDYRLPEECIKQSRREILLLGHLSKGLGRHTFCYTCNINMMMAIVSYVLEHSGRTGRIDFVITGDSKHEKQTYRNWLEQLFLKIYPNSEDNLIVKITKLKQDFNEFIKNDKMQNGKRPVKFDELPNFLEIFEYTDYQYPQHSKLMGEIGFKLDPDSFNFTESDCKYPAVMAYLANIRGEIKIHVEFIEKLMHNKNFSREMKESALNEYRLGISDKKQMDIITFCKNSLTITEEQLSSMVVSPFLNKAEKLDSFLKDKRLSLDKADIIRYIDGKDESTEKREIIEDFFQKYIGLSVSDIRVIYEQIGESDNLLTKMSSDDPYVTRDATGRVISGR